MPKNITKRALSPTETRSTHNQLLIHNCYQTMLPKPLPLRQRGEGASACRRRPMALVVYQRRAHLPEKGRRGHDNNEENELISRFCEESVRSMKGAERPPATAPPPPNHQFRD